MEKLKLNPSCEICGSSLLVDVHHKIYGFLYDVTFADLKTLCRRHHEKEHERLDEIKRNVLLKRNKRLTKRTRRLLIKKVTKVAGFTREMVEEHYNMICSRK